MKSKNILEITDFTKKELLKLIQRSLFLKKNNTKNFSSLKNKRIGLLFDATSLRTKMSFEMATHKLGGFPYFVDINSITHEADAPRESFEDIVDTLDKFVDAYVVRDYSQNTLNVLKRKDYPPVINAFSLVGHPSQALADLSTIFSKKTNFKDLHIAALCPETGSGVIESFAYGVLLLGGTITLITPTGKFSAKNRDFTDVIQTLPGVLSISKDVENIIKNTDVLYVDEWWYPGAEFLKKKPPKRYRADKDSLKNAKQDLIILHCLPAHHNREISEEVFYSPQSIVFEEAEFRIYAAMALLEYLAKH